MNQDEVESQLSAMFDGELPPAECELLSRRIDRDENLRARWSRYALIGAAMRCEPVATARSDFAARVSSAVDHDQARQVGAATSQVRAGRDRQVRGGRDRQVRAGRHRYLIWQSVLAGTLVVAVAGLSILMLRNVALNSVNPVALLAGSAAGTARAALAALPLSAAELLARQREAMAVLGTSASASHTEGTQASPNAVREPWSYVTPPDDRESNSSLRTELVDYIVAHSDFSTPLMRPDLLSALVSGGEGSDASSTPAALAGPAAFAPAAAVGDNASAAASSAGR